MISFQYNLKWWLKWQGNMNCKALKLQGNLKYKAILHTRQFKETQFKLQRQDFFSIQFKPSGDWNDKEILIATYYKLQGSLKYKAILNTRLFIL
jgi:hypothetical protein